MNGLRLHHLSDVNPPLAPESLSLFLTYRRSRSLFGRAAAENASIVRKGALVDNLSKSNTKPVGALGTHGSRAATRSCPPFQGPKNALLRWRN